MHTLLLGKVICIMPRKYDDEFKARAVGLVTDHAEECDTPHGLHHRGGHAVGSALRINCAGGSTNPRSTTDT